MEAIVINIGSELMFALLGFAAAWALGKLFDTIGR
jgi:hypothetical protein